MAGGRCNHTGGMQQSKYKINVESHTALFAVLLSREDVEIPSRKLFLAGEWRHRATHPRSKIERMVEVQFSVTSKKALQK